MSDDEYRNPSPPSELVEHKDYTADMIGDTVFSKHWLFTALMKLIQAVDKEETSKEAGEEGLDVVVVDIDDDLQNELCKLWDMSMNKDVAMCLIDFKAVDILVGVLTRTRAPRIAEIAMGILGNLSCCRESGGGAGVVGDSHVRVVVLTLLETINDAPTLIEATRFLRTCLTWEETRAAWLESIRASDSFVGHMMFMLGSSTNNDLIRNVAKIIDELMDIDDDLCATFTSRDLVVAVIEAVKQVGAMCSEDAESLLHILTFFGMTAGGSTALAENREGVFGIVTGFLHSICALEIVPLALRQTVLASCFCVAGAVVAAPPSDDGVELVEQDPCVLKFAMHILEVLHRKEEQRRISQEESSTGSHADATVTSSGQKSNDRDAEAGGADRPFRTVDGAEDSSEVTRERTTAADSADNRASGRADSTEQAGDVPSPRTKESSEVVEQQVAPGDVSNEEPAAILHEQLMRFIRDLIMALPQEQFSPIHAILNEAKRSQRLLLLRHLLDESPECVRRLRAVAALKGSRLHHLQHAIAGLLPEKEEDGKGSPTAAASSSSVS